MGNRIMKAITDFTFDTMTDIIDVVSLFILAIVHFVEITAWTVSDFLIRFRQKRGMEMHQFDATLEEWQIYNFAQGLKLTPWERREIERIGEIVVLRQYRVSRRQARKIIDMYRLCHKNAAKMSA
jgi:hypothetical protein